MWQSLGIYLANGSHLLWKSVTSSVLPEMVAIRLDLDCKSWSVCGVHLQSAQLWTKPYYQPDTWIRFQDWVRLMSSSLAHNLSSQINHSLCLYTSPLMSPSISTVPRSKPGVEQKRLECFFPPNSCQVGCFFKGAKKNETKRQPFMAKNGQSRIVWMQLFSGNLDDFHETLMQ